MADKLSLTVHQDVFQLTTRYSPLLCKAGVEPGVFPTLVGNGDGFPSEVDRPPCAGSVKAAAGVSGRTVSMSGSAVVARSRDALTEGAVRCRRSRPNWQGLSSNSECNS